MNCLVRSGTILSMVLKKCKSCTTPWILGLFGLTRRLPLLSFVCAVGNVAVLKPPKKTVLKQNWFVDFCLPSGNQRWLAGTSTNCTYDVPIETSTNRICFPCFSMVSHKLYMIFPSFPMVFIVDFQ